MPVVKIRTVAEGREQTLTEHLCDWPDCPNVAVEVVGFTRELRLATAYCAAHAPRVSRRNADS
jgi:hypothetical protein